LKRNEKTNARNWKKNMQEKKRKELNLIEREEKMKRKKKKMHTKNQ